MWSNLQKNRLVKQRPKVVVVSLFLFILSLLNFVFPVCFRMNYYFGSFSSVFPKDV